MLDKYLHGSRENDPKRSVLAQPSPIFLSKYFFPSLVGSADTEATDRKDQLEMDTVRFSPSHTNLVTPYLRSRFFHYMKLTRTYNHSCIDHHSVPKTKS